MFNKEQHGNSGTGVNAFDPEASGGFVLSAVDDHNRAVVKVEVTASEITSIALSVGTALALPLFIYLCMLHPDMLNAALPIIVWVSQRMAHRIKQHRREKKCIHCHR